MQENGVGLEPFVRAFIDAAEAIAFPPGVRFGMAEGDAYLARQRALPRKLVATPTPVAEMLELVTPSGIPVRVYRPGTEPDHALIVYLHGGGWVLGDLEMHDETCRTLTNEANSVVVNVGYRLAPETPYPGPLDDALEATEWAIAQAVHWGADPRLCFVGGTSAGGNLAAAVALRRRDRASEPPIAGQILIYPVLDVRMATGSYTAKAEGFFLTADQMRFYWDAYVQDPAYREDCEASPSLATDVGGLPPAIVVVAEHDPLRDEGEQYAARLDAKGALIELIEVPGQIHGFLTAFRGTPVADGTLARIAQLVVGLVERRRSAA